MDGRIKIVVVRIEIRVDGIQCICSGFQQKDLAVFAHIVVDLFRIFHGGIDDDQGLAFCIRCGKRNGICTGFRIDLRKFRVICLIRGIVCGCGFAIVRMFCSCLIRCGCFCCLDHCACFKKHTFFQLEILYFLLLHRLFLLIRGKGVLLSFFYYTEYIIIYDPVIVNMYNGFYRKFFAKNSTVRFSVLAYRRKRCYIYPVALCRGAIPESMRKILKNIIKI